MRHGTLRVPAVALALALAAAGCGKRGNPQAPIRPLPGPPTSVSARRVGDRVDLRFIVPAENQDRSMPAVISAVEIYAAVGPPTPTAPAPFAIPPVALSIPIGGAPVAVPSVPFPLSRLTPVRLAEPPEVGAVAATRSKRREAPATTAAAIMTSKHLRTRIAVQPPAEPSAGEPSAATPAAPTDDRPAPGAPAAYSDQIGTERAAAAATPDASVLRYVVVGVAGKRRLGVPSPILEVPLTVEVGPPTDVAATYDEKAITLTWTAAAGVQTFRVYAADAKGEERAAPLNETPLTAPTFSLPVEFGGEKCFTVRAVVARGPSSVESEAAGPACLTPVDTFPPPAPTGLSGLPTETQIQLLWMPVTAADLAGYIVLRGQDGSTPVPIVTAPVSEPRYTDTNVSAGVRYTYVVVAVDKAGNRSQPSNALDEVR